MGSTGEFLNRVLYGYLKILGLCPFDIVDKNILVRSKSSTIYTCSLGAIFTIMYFRVITWRIFFIFPCETPMTVISDVISTTLEFLTVISVWTNAVFSQDLLRTIIKSFKAASNSLQQFDIDDDHISIIRRTNLLLFLVNILYIIAGIYTDAVRPHSKIINMPVWIAFNYLRTPGHIITVIFVSVLMMLNQQLRLANEFLRKFPSNFGDLSKTIILRER